MSQKLPAVSGSDLIKALQRAGFVLRRQKGSHVHLFRNADKRRVTVPVHGTIAIAEGTLKAILRDADLTVEDLRKLL